MNFKGQCRELPLCAESGEECEWRALPSPVQCEETATRTQDLPVTGGKTLPLAPGPPFKNYELSEPKKTQLKQKTDTLNCCYWQYNKC